MFKSIEIKLLSVLFSTRLSAIILLFFLIITRISSFGQAGKQTTIVVNFKTNADRRFTAFGQLNPLHLEPAIVAPPEHKIDTSNKLRTVIRLAIAEPKYLALGFNIFYVKPGDSVNVNYETLFHTKMEFKDSILVNYGNTFFLFRNGENGPLHKSFMNNVYQTLSGFKSASQITSYLSPADIRTLGGAYARLTYSANPNLVADSETKKNVEYITFQAFERQLLYKIKSVYESTKSELLRSAILQGVTYLICLLHNKRECC